MDVTYMCTMMWHCCTKRYILIDRYVRNTLTEWRSIGIWTESKISGRGRIAYVMRRRKNKHSGWATLFSGMSWLQLYLCINYLWNYAFSLEVVLSILKGTAIVLKLICDKALICIFWDCKKSFINSTINHENSRWK